MLELELLNDKEFFDIYYRKKPILQDEFDEFLKALKTYKANLLKNLHENEDALVANALVPLFQKLGFETQVKSKQKGKSEIDLALLKKNSPLNADGGGLVKI